VDSVAAKGRPATADEAAPPPAVPELAIVIPTFNERDNIPLLIERFRTTFGAIRWEVIFVDDDSPDGTAAVARQIGEQDGRVRCLRRLGRRGLAGACIEGMLSTQAPYIAVMDADLQHDEALLTGMMKLLEQNEADLVVGARRLTTENAVPGLTTDRLKASQFAIRYMRLLLGITTDDPLSGFFMIKREIFETVAPRLSTQGFKILADILISAPRGLRVRELPYTFRTRVHGASKLDSRVVLDFAGLLIAKISGDAIPVRFFGFLLVGASGIVVHLLVLMAALDVLGLRFGLAQTLATFVSMTSNFILNNLLTYHDQRLTGLDAIRGLLVFYAVCSVGAISNIGVASWLYASEPSWWVAGLAGSFVGAVWNFALSNTYVWRPVR
jgi:dolichol-phosphate mannosyltransferase